MGVLACRSDERRASLPQVESAKFALNHGVHCILGNGHQQDVLQKIFEGRSVGTLFSRQADNHAAPHVRAIEARSASRELLALPASERVSVDSCARPCPVLAATRFARVAGPLYLS